MDTVEAPSPKEAEAKKFPVLEIFGPVIQGEGSQAGTQTLFIRFGGCDYKCQKCDSLHAVIPQAIKKHAEWLTAVEIFDRVNELRLQTNVQWVTFSGGNPCMHKLDALVVLLNQTGIMINVETQATLWQEWLYHCTTITVSPKSWGMGEKFEEGKYRKFLQRLNGTRPLCVKVVVFSEVDIEFALGIYQITEEEEQNWLYGYRGATAYYLSLGNPYPPVLTEDFELAPNPELVVADERSELVSRLLSSYKRLSEELLADTRMKMFRFLPQLHVLIYGNETGR